MWFYFNPDGAQAASNDEFALGLFDDPFMTDGDRTDFKMMNGAFVQGSAPAGIVTMCPGNQPTPIRYEIKRPYAAIGVTAGQAHDLGFAFEHAGSKWPASLTIDMATMRPIDPSTCGEAVVGDVEMT